VTTGGTTSDESPFTATDSDDSDDDVDMSVIGTDSDSVANADDDDDKSVIGTDRISGSGTDGGLSDELFGLLDTDGGGVGGGELSSDDWSDEIFTVGRLIRLVRELSGLSGMSELSESLGGVESGELESDTRGELVCEERFKGASSMVCSMVGSCTEREISSRRFRTTLDRRRDAIGGLVIDTD
jgi:hypothetical protein